MRDRNDNDAADEEREDERNSLLEALVKAEAGPGFCCLLQEAPAMLFPHAPLWVDLIGHGLNNRATLVDCLRKKRQPCRSGDWMTRAI